MYKHCTILLRIPWKDGKSKKTLNRGTRHMAHAPRHLSNKHNDEGSLSVCHSLQAAEDRDSNHNEEIPENQINWTKS